MAEHIRQQLLLLVEEWRSRRQVQSFTARADQFERGYRAGFSKGMEACSEELEVVVKSWDSLSVDEL